MRGCGRGQIEHEFNIGPLRASSTPRAPAASLSRSSHQRLAVRAAPSLRFAVPGAPAFRFAVPQIVPPLRRPCSTGPTLRRPPILSAGGVPVAPDLRCTILRSSASARPCDLEPRGSPRHRPQVLCGAGGVPAAPEGRPVVVSPATIYRHRPTSAVILHHEGCPYSPS